MRTSGICLLNKHLRPFRNRRGFTLLEILFVLSILGLLAGLALPRMTALYDSFQWAGERDEALRALADLGLTASRQSREFELTSYPAPENAYLPLTLPADWTFTAMSPIRYRHNGICLGGKGRLARNDRVIDIVLKPPLCQPELP